MISISPFIKIKKKEILRKKIDGGQRLGAELYRNILPFCFAPDGSQPRGGGGGDMTYTGTCRWTGYEIPNIMRFIM